MHVHICCISLRASDTFEFCDYFISVSKTLNFFFQIKNIVKV